MSSITSSHSLVVDHNPNALIQIQGIYPSQYYAIAGITILYYGHLITLPLEIRYIWNDKTTFTSIVFLLNRYIIFFGYIAYAVFYFGFIESGHTPLRSCERFIWFPGILMCLTQAAAAGILVKRFNAFRRNKLSWMVIALSVGGISTVACSFWTLTLTKSTGVSLTLRDRTLRSCINIGSKWSTGYYTTTLISILFDLTALIVILKDVTRRRKEVKNAGLRTELYDFLRIDGLVYFFIVALVNLVNLCIFYKNQLHGIPTFAQMGVGNNNVITHVVTTTMISRFVLNLRHHLESTKSQPDDYEYVTAEASWWGSTFYYASESRAGYTNIF